MRAARRDQHRSRVPAGQIFPGRRPSPAGSRPWRRGRTTFHGDLGRQPRGSAMEYHDRALEEVERAFAGRAEHEVVAARSEEHTSELQSRQYLVCRLLLEKKK